MENKKAKRTEEAFKEVSNEKFVEMLEEIYNPELVKKYMKRKDLWIR